MLLSSRRNNDERYVITRVACTAGQGIERGSCLCSTHRITAIRNKPAKLFIHASIIGIWCNGNTKDFDSFVVGSNPAIPANAVPLRLIKEVEIRCHEGDVALHYALELKQAEAYMRIAFRSCGKWSEMNSLL